MNGDLGFKGLFLGTGRLYQFFSHPDTFGKTSTVILARNIRRRYHDLDEERRLANANASSGDAYSQLIDIRAYQTMKTRRSERWQPSQSEIEVFSPDDILTLLPVSIQSLSTGGRSPSQASYDAENPWLPAPDVRRFPCEIECEILQKNRRSSSDFSYRRVATLVCLPTTEDVRITIEFPSGPFEVPRHRLPMTKISSREIEVRFIIWIIDDCERINLARLMGLQSLQDVHEIVHFSASIPVVIGQKRRQQGQLRAHRGGQKMRLEVDLSIESDWAPKSQSVLRTVQQVKVEDEAQVSATSTSDAKATSAALSHELTYIWEGVTGLTRSLQALDLRCQFCRSRLPHSSLQQLRAHYKNHHDHFDFRVQREQDHLDDARRVTIYVELKDAARRAKDKAFGIEDKDFTWIRPQRPFDMHTYLKGRHDWVTEGYGGPRTLDPARAERHQPTGGLPSPISMSEPPQDESTREVEPVQPRKRKRYVVPDIPGVDLYRTANKRRLTAGETLSESEDDSEDDWAFQKKRLRLSSLPGKSGGKFFDLYDDFVSKEALSSDLHLQDTTIRFCKRYKERLSQPLVFHDLKIKLEQLRMTGLIPRRVEDLCLEIVTDGGGAPKLSRWSPNPDQLDPYAFSDTISSMAGLKNLLARWDEVPDPRDVPNAHPLTTHPEVTRMFGYAALHPHVQKNLGKMLTDSKSLAACKTMFDNLTGLLDIQKTIILEYPDYVQDRQYEDAVKTASGRCVCGEAAGQTRGTIMCSNVRCRKAPFHLACVNLTTRDPSWKCADCAGRSTPWILTEKDLKLQKQINDPDTLTIYNPRMWLKRMLQKSSEQAEAEVTV